MSADLLRRLIEAGTPADLIAEVAMLAGSVDALATRRANERANSARYRQRGGGQIPGWMRREVFERDGYVCVDCGAEDRLQIDHVIPLAANGPTELDNLQTLCGPCNARKKDRVRKADERGRTRTNSDKDRIPGTAADVTGPGSLDKESPQTPKEIKPSREVNTLPACATLDLPEGVSDEMWGQYRAMRQKIRKPLSPHAEQLALKHLRQFAEDGHPPGPIIEAAIVGSYQGLFPPKGSKNGQHRKPDHEWGSTVAAAQSLIADLSRGQGTGSADRPPGAGH